MAQVWDDKWSINKYLSGDYPDPGFTLGPESEGWTKQGRCAPAPDEDLSLRENRHKTNNYTKSESHKVQEVRIE